MTITHDQGNNFPYFTVANGVIVPKTISVSFSNLTIFGADGTVLGAGSLGGAFNNAAALSLDNVALRNNSANKGGAIYNATTGVLSLSNCIVSQNQAIGAGNEGGAIFATGNSSTSVSNTTFDMNTAAGGKGGAISFNFQSTLSLTDTNLTNNTAGYGGAVYASVGNAAAVPFTMMRGTVAHNRATVQGGGLFLSSTNARIDGTQFTDNGAMRGGAIYTKLNNLQLLNCDFTLNTATNLGPIIAYVGNLGQTVTITQTNCTGIVPADYIFDPNL